MISLRQHIFSLVAVFVALAIGIAAGSTVVRGPLLDSTRSRLESAEELIEQERAENDVLAAELAQLDALGEDGPAQLLAGRLTGSAVVLVVAGDVDGDVVAGVLRALAVASDGFVGEVRIDPGVFDPEQVDRVAGEIGVVAGGETDVANAFGLVLARRLADLGGRLADGEAAGAATRATFGDLEDSGLIDLLQLSEGTVPVDAFDVVLLSDRNLAHDPTAVLEGLITLPDVVAQPAGFAAPPRDGAAPVDTGSDGTTPSGSGPDATSDPDTTTDPETTDPETTDEPDTTDTADTEATTTTEPPPIEPPRPVVLIAEVGRITQDNDSPVPSFVGAIRDSGRLRDEFSTVDNAETVLGWIAIVLGLDAAERGEVGQYGFRDGADRAVPRRIP